MNEFWLDFKLFWTISNYAVYWQSVDEDSDDDVNDREEVYK